MNQQPPTGVAPRHSHGAAPANPLTDRANAAALDDPAAPALRSAARALHEIGVSSPVLAGAVGAPCWNAVETRMVWQELRRFAAQLPRAGIDPALLPIPEHPNPPFPAARGVHDIAITATLPMLSSAAVLGVPSSKPPLEFDGTYDGLRGVPIKDLVGVSKDAGVSDDEAERLDAAGISSVHALLSRIPHRYIDRTDLVPLDRLRPGMTRIAFVAQVTSSGTYFDRRGRQHTRIHVGLGRHRLTSTHFNCPWLAERFTVGDLALLVGDVTEWRGQLQMAGAAISKLDEATTPTIPIYPQLEKHNITKWLQGRAALDALRRLPQLDDPVPENIRSARGLPTRLEALRAAHVPDSAAHARAGRDRLAYDELLLMQLAMGVQRNAQRSQPALIHAPTGQLTRPWLARLPWPLTGAQRRCLKEIANDLRAPHPMRRLLQGDVGAGKAQPLDSLVLTPRGFKAMADIQIGDAVVNPTGQITHVKGVYPQGVRDVFRIHFADGTSVRADGEHLWAVRTSVMRHKHREPKILTTREIASDLTETNGASKWHVELAEPVDLDDGSSRPIDAYLLGVLLGDGSLNGGCARITTGDPELVAHVQECLPLGTQARTSVNPKRPSVITIAITRVPQLDVTGPLDGTDLRRVKELYDAGHSVAQIALAAGETHAVLARRMRKADIRMRPSKIENPIVSSLRALGLAGTKAASKFVPKAYLNAPIKVRHAVLQGLLDTDGTLDYRTGCNVSFSTISHALAEDVAWLARSLGGVANVAARNRQSGKSFHVRVTLPNEFEPFRLTRKAMWVHERSKYRHPARTIVSIEPAGSEPVQCIAVAHPNHLYVTDNFTPTHNTAVAICSLIMAVESGYQGALMAPLAVLVHQHFDDIAAACDPLGIRVALLPGTGKIRARREVLAGLASGDIQIVVGTTGLLQPEVVFNNLGLAVIDEQHRFGVEQRAALVNKAPGDAVADELGATATPIPRTAAMTQFGDVDISVLDELPPGRTPIATTWIAEVPLHDPRHRHWTGVRDQVTAGRQAFVVCPLVAHPVTDTGQESAAQAAAAVDTAAALEAGALAGLRIGVATGRQKPAERAEVMAAFVAGSLDVLVATTVIEVGVSVPNATSITVLDAGKFGLAQLHQLRGRVGRGQHPGSCVLTGQLGEVSGKRIEAMCATTDGFALAEVDFTIRGAGSLAGTAQSGHRAGLEVADLLTDACLMHQARQDAAHILAGDPFLGRRPTLRTEVELALGANAHYLQQS